MPDQVEVEAPLLATTRSSRWAAASSGGCNSPACQIGNIFVADRPPASGLRAKIYPSAKPLQIAFAGPVPVPRSCQLQFW